MNILAIDPAARTGYAHTNGERGVWLLDKGEGRCYSLDKLLSNAIEDWGCNVIAYESATFGSHHAHVQRMHNELAGVIRLVAMREHVQCWAYTPSQWKAIALGAGRANKEKVKWLLKQIYDVTENDSDIADALGVLAAAERGPPPESKAKQRRAAEKRIAKAARLFP